MIHKLWPICLLLLLVLLALQGSAVREPRADLVYVNPSDIHTLDPARMSWIQDFRVALNIWEGLTTWHPRTTAPVEAGARLPPEISDDGTLYRFTLRDDARWSNGEPVTAHDYVRGWRRCMEPGTAADYASLFTDHVEGAAEYVAWRQRAVAELTALASTGSVAAADKRFDEHVAEFETRFNFVGIVAKYERTLEVRLNNPCPYFLDLLALPAFVPCHASIERLRERHRDGPINSRGLVVYDSQWTKPDCRRSGYPGLVTNGPYRLSDWSFKRRARLTINPFHRAAATTPCRIVDMLVYDNLNAALMAYEAGYVDLLPELSVPYDHEIARLSLSGERPDFHQCAVPSTYFLNFNCADAVAAGRLNPFTDPRVRRAFCLALDKHRLVHRVRARGDRVAHSFVPPEGMDGYRPPRGLPFDSVEARRILAEAGFPGGRDLPTITLLGTQNDERVCQAIARMWQDALGAHVVLETKESKTFAADKDRRAYLVARGNWFADYADPTTFLDCLAADNGNNDCGYANAGYDELLRRAAQTSDRDARFELLAEAEAMVIERDCPILPIFHYTEPIALQPRIKGLYPNGRLWFPFRHAHVER
jgi:oligopeptide transport system substrate-binding protein